MSANHPKLYSIEEINQRFNLEPYDVIGSASEVVLLFDGDTTFNGDIDRAQIEGMLAELRTDTGTDSLLVMINGNLTVAGEINIGDYHPHLLVLGNLYCDVLVSADDTMYITGDAHIKYVYYGYYNDGSITIAGTTYVPYVVNSDHHSAITPEGAILINAYSDHNDFFEYDYTDEVLPEVLQSAALNDKGEFDIWKFIKLVQLGQSPFKEGVKPLRLVYEEELERITSGDISAITELDWSDKKAKAFPASIAKLKHLKKLNLSKNIISEIPAIIGELENLEELNLDSCGLTTIHEAIGRLKKLKVLNLKSNYHLTAFPETLGNLVSLQELTIDYISTPLPGSLARLHNLEALSMYQCYNDMKDPAPFPEVLTKLKNLKRWDFRENKVQQLPDSILQIQTLEEFLWTGGVSLGQNFPDFTKFPNLKKLVIPKKFHSWRNRVFDITSLEHLEIDRSKEQRQRFNQDTLNSWIEMAPTMDEDFQKRIQWMQENKQEEPNGWFSVLLMPGMKQEDLQGINKLQRLKYLDLSYNDLTGLPDTFFELRNLQYLDVRSNKFPEALQERINKAFPDTKVIWQ